MSEIEVDRMSDRSYSYSPSPPRGHRRRGKSPSPRVRYGGRDRDLPTSLLVRNLRLDCRPEDLRKPFGQFGCIRDIYLPRDYYTGEPRGFGFVQFVDPEDAADAKYKMDGQFFLGRELSVVFAEENRKRPTDMRARDRPRGRTYGHRKSYYHSRSPCFRSRSRYSRSRSPRHSRYSRSPSPRRSSQYRSPSPRYCRSSRYVRTPSYTPSPRRQRYSRSVSPLNQSSCRGRSHSGSPSNSWSRCRSPAKNYKRGSQRLHSRSPSNNRSRSRSPVENYKRSRRIHSHSPAETASQGAGALQKTNERGSQSERSPPANE